MNETLSEDKHLENWDKLDQNCALQRTFLLINGDTDEIPDTITADIDIWKVRLTSENGELVSVVGDRKGERYSFEKSASDDAISASSNNVSRLLSPQLHNLAVMAVRDDIHWEPIRNLT